MKSVFDLEAELHDEETELDRGFDVSEGEEAFARLGSDNEGEGLFESPVIKDSLLGFGRPLPRDGEMYGPSEEEFEIIGADDRILVRNTLRVPFRWICSLDLYFPDPDDPSRERHYRGSGTLISPRHALTAGHNIYDRIKGSKGTFAVSHVGRAVVTPARNGAARTASAKSPLGTTHASAFHISRHWRITRNKEFDFGLITLADAVGSKRYPMLGNQPLGYWGSRRWGTGTRIRPRRPEVLQGKSVNISGYPADKCGIRPPGGSTSRSCPDSWATAQWRAFSRVTNAKPPSVPRLLFHSLDTFAGHSGSPVWLRWRQFRNLIAIHTSAPRTGSNNEAVRITRQVIREVQSWM